MPEEYECPCQNASPPYWRINEGTLEWIQVSESCHRLRRGRYMVCALSGRQEGIARFVTVSGQCLSPEKPKTLYRKCGFIGMDIWPVLHPASPNG